MSAHDPFMPTRVREVTAEERAAEVGLVALEARKTRTAPVTRRLHRTLAGVRRAPVVDDLITELGLGRIRRVAFVVLGEATCTLPLYDVAITTARRGWSIGIADARYWFITSEPVPLAGFGPAARAGISARLEPEGITFIGSTFADLRPGLVLLILRASASRSIASSRSRTPRQPTSDAPREVRRWDAQCLRRRRGSCGTPRAVRLGLAPVSAPVASRERVDNDNASKCRAFSDRGDRI